MISVVKLIPGIALAEIFCNKTELVIKAAKLAVVRPEILADVRSSILLDASVVMSVPQLETCVEDKPATCPLVKAVTLLLIRLAVTPGIALELKFVNILLT